MRTIIVPALAVLSLALTPAPVAAEAVSVSVPYNDLDLTSAEGLATLEGRIEAAAKQICAPVAVRSSLQNPTRANCVREVIASTRVQLAAVFRDDRRLALGNSDKPRD